MTTTVTERDNEITLLRETNNNKDRRLLQLSLLEAENKQLKASNIQINDEKKSLDEELHRRTEKLG